MFVYKHLGRFCTVIYNFNYGFMFNAKTTMQSRVFRLPEMSNFLTKDFQTSSRNRDLMEFFESEKNWDSNEVKVGRSWKLDELRIKSNSDLHKLWFVLLKEKNMLLTMEHEYKEKSLPMPNPERIHKVDESMRNLETIVRERNRAYYQLETGETGEQEVVDDYNTFGLPYKRKLTEHYVDKKYDLFYRKRSISRHRIVFDKDVIWFVKRFNEKIRRKEFSITRRRYRHVCGLLKRFEGIDEEAVKEQFPDVDLEEAKRDIISRGPRLNMY